MSERIPPDPPARPGRGGKRPGAGRPRLGVDTIEVTLTPPVTEKARRIGRGNVSHGIRIAVQAYPEGEK
jgi:hypothetical protein